MKKSDRFYPEDYHRFDFEPTRDNFRIISEEQFGDGIISLARFNPGDVVFKFTGEILNVQTLFTLQIKDGEYIHDPYFMGKVLHSCEPNMICDMATRTFYAAKEIRSGDYLTMDYETTEDELFRSFYCGCGSENCRGLIRGKKYANVRSAGRVSARV